MKKGQKTEDRQKREIRSCRKDGFIEIGGPDSQIQTASDEKEITTMNKAQEELLVALQTSATTGLSRDEASKRRQDDESFYTVPPPLDCPSWVCCLL